MDADAQFPRRMLSPVIARLPWSTRAVATETDWSNMKLRLPLLQPFLLHLAAYENSLFNAQTGQIDMQDAIGLRSIEQGGKLELVGIESSSKFTGNKTRAIQACNVLSAIRLIDVAADVEGYPAATPRPRRLLAADEKAPDSMKYLLDWPKLLFDFKKNIESKISPLSRPNGNDGSTFKLLQHLLQNGANESFHRKMGNFLVVATNIAYMTDTSINNVTQSMSVLPGLPDSIHLAPQPNDSEFMKVLRAVAGANVSQKQILADGSASLSGLRGALQGCLAISPLYLLCNVNLCKQDWNRRSLIEVAEALGNDKPPVLVEVERLLWETVFSLSAGEVDPYNAMRQLCQKLPWEKIAAVNSPAARDDLEWFNLRRGLQQPLDLPPISTIVPNKHGLISNHDGSGNSSEPLSRKIITDISIVPESTLPISTLQKYASPSWETTHQYGIDDHEAERRENMLLPDDKSTGEPDHHPEPAPQTSAEMSIGDAAEANQDAAGPDHSLTDNEISPDQHGRQQSARHLDHLRDINVENGGANGGDGGDKDVYMGDAGHVHPATCAGSDGTSGSIEFGGDEDVDMRVERRFKSATTDGAGDGTVNGADDMMVDGHISGQDVLVKSTKDKTTEQATPSTPSSPSATTYLPFNPVAPGPVIQGRPPASTTATAPSPKDTDEPQEDKSSPVPSNNHNPSSPANTSSTKDAGKPQEVISPFYDSMEEEEVVSAKTDAFDAKAITSNQELRRSSRIDQATKDTGEPQEFEAVRSSAVLINHSPSSSAKDAGTSRDAISSPFDDSMEEEQVVLAKAGKTEAKEMLSIQEPRRSSRIDQATKPVPDPVQEHHYLQKAKASHTGKSSKKRQPSERHAKGNTITDPIDVDDSFHEWMPNDDASKPEDESVRTLQDGKHIPKRLASSKVLRAWGPRLEDNNSEPYEFRPKFHFMDYHQRLDTFFDRMEEGYVNGLPLHLARPAESIIEVMNHGQFLKKSVREIGEKIVKKALIVTGCPSETVGFEKAVKALHPLHGVASLQDYSASLSRLPLAERPEFHSVEVIKGTVKQLIRHALDPDGLILNGLEFPQISEGDGPSISNLAVDAVAFVQMRPHRGTLTESFPISHMRWGLAGTKDTVTWIHVDSDGLNTFVRIKCGKKVWGFIREGTGYSFASLMAYINDDFHLDQIKKETNEQGASKWPKYEVEAVVLSPGDMLVMRANTPHFVFGPEATVCEGGHFYNSFTMQQTASGIMHSFIIHDFITNIHHDPTRLLLRRIALFYYLGLIQGKIDPDDDAYDHLPDVTTLSGLLDLLSLCNLVIMGNVLDYRTYRAPNQREDCQPTEKQRRRMELNDFNHISYPERREIIEARGACWGIFGWIRAQSKVTGPNSEVIEDFPSWYLAKQLKALLAYKNHVDKQNNEAVDEFPVEGAPHCTVELLTRQINNLVASNAGLTACWDSGTAQAKDGNIRLDFGPQEGYSLEWTVDRSIKEADLTTFFTNGMTDFDRKCWEMCQAIFGVDNMHMDDDAEPPSKRFKKTH